MKRGVMRLSAGQQRLAFSLFLSNSLSITLFLLRVISSGTTRFDFMLWNLFLAIVPLFFSTYLALRLARSRWLSWQNLLLTGLWFGFLPNSFYLITDLIHLQPSGEINLLFDTVMIVSFIFNGLVLGYLSLYQMHRLLLARVSWRRAHAVIAMVLFFVSFAIYLGRILRWNSWDIIVHPAGLLFDVSMRLIHPITYPGTFLTTGTFWLLLGVMYVVIWQVIEILRPTRPKA